MELLFDWFIAHTRPSHLIFFGAPDDQLERQFRQLERQHTLWTADGSIIQLEAIE